jgi:hypothetical protein
MLTFGVTVTYAELSWGRRPGLPKTGARRRMLGNCLISFVFAHPTQNPKRQNYVEVAYLGSR